MKFPWLNRGGKTHNEVYSALLSWNRGENKKHTLNVAFSVLFAQQRKKIKTRQKYTLSCTEIVLLGEYRCSSRVDGCCSAEVPVLVLLAEWMFLRKFLQNREGKGMLGFLLDKVLKVTPTNTLFCGVFLGFWDRRCSVSVVTQGNESRQFEHYNIRHIMMSYKHSIISYLF